MLALGPFRVSVCVLHSGLALLFVVDSHVSHLLTLTAQMHALLNPHSTQPTLLDKLLDELWTECEALMDRGIMGDTTGAGAPGFSFTGEGKRLDAGKRNGGGSARSRAAEAALARQNRHITAPPRVLGGKRRSSEGKTLRELAAEAAIRRVRDEVWCGSQVSGGEGGAAAASADPPLRSASTTAKPGSLTRQTVTPSVGPTSMRGRLDPAAQARAQGKRPAAASAAAAAPVRDEGLRAGSSLGVTGSATGSDTGGAAGGTMGWQSRHWHCAACTFLNPKPLALVCEVCATVR